MVSCIRHDNPMIPATVCLGEKKTPVWIQTQWQQGEFAVYIRRNGCGHCCTAMAANLHGVTIDPYGIYTLCRKLWGTPENGQDHFLSVGGITKVLRHLQIPAQCFGVAEGEEAAAASHIMECLKMGKQVIFISDPFRDPGNLFSTGYHYVLAVGIQEDGRVLIANSSETVTAGGVQTATETQIASALYQGGTANEEMTWGEIERLWEGCTYVVAG